MIDPSPTARVESQPPPPGLSSNARSIVKEPDRSESLLSMRAARLQGIRRGFCGGFGDESEREDLQES